MSPYMYICMYKFACNSKVQWVKHFGHLVKLFKPDAMLESFP